jgi:UDP-N-acetylmuramate--alanine ligase
MVASILTTGGLDPTVIIGGRLDIWGGSNAKLGQGDILVTESDESDGSFMALSPTIAVVTNIDNEHIDHYGHMDVLRKTFIDVINKVPFYGLSVLCIDDEEIQGVIPDLKKKYVTYGMASQADLRARDIEKQQMGVSFELLWKKKPLGRILVGKPGKHNALNALAAIAVALELEMDMEKIKEGLAHLGGLARRFEIKGERGGVLILDDYGHHPTEIAVTLETARECWPERRLVVVFQPHRYSRTRALYDRFVKSFYHADSLVLAPLYSAGESPLEGVDSEWLLKGIKEHGHRDVVLKDRLSDIPKHLIGFVKPGDVVLTLGAGDVYRVGEELMKGLKP